MRHTFLTSLGAAALGLSLGARADDGAVARKMHHANHMEIEAGKLATSNSSTDEVKKFGQMLQDDHTKADAELQATASSMKVDLGNSGVGMGTGTGMHMKGKTAEDESTDRSVVKPDDKTMARNDNVDRSSGKESSGNTKEDEAKDRAAKKTDTGDTTAAERNPARTATGEDRSSRTQDGQATDRSVKVNNDADDKDGAMHGGMMKGRMHGEHHQASAMMTNLKSLHGREFDKQFLTMMVKDHEKDISELQDARKSMKYDDALGQLIDKQLPTLQKHQETAKRLLSKIVPQARRP